MAAVRYTGLFRTAAVVFLLLGGAWLWTGLLTDFRPQMRPYLLTLGLMALVLAVFLFRCARWAIAVSAAAAVVVAISAVLFVPNASGPGILFLIGLAVAGGLYAALSFRVLFAPRDSAR
jgi:hypothetical protein